MAWVLFSQQNTVKTANQNSRINFYFVTCFYSCTIFAWWTGGHHTAANANIGGYGVLTVYWLYYVN